MDKTKAAVGHLTAGNIHSAGNISTTGTTDGVDISAETINGFSVATGTTVLHTNATARTTFSATYALLKETKVFAQGVVSVIFDLATNNAAMTATGRIYVNGGAVGTERTKTGDTNYTTQAAEDITVAFGDLVQVYGKTSDVSWSCGIQNLIIKGTLTKAYGVATAGK